jgi:hypothetical protein
LFVDEVLLEQYDALEDLSEDVDAHDFDVEGTPCHLTISASRATLLANGVEIPQEKQRS